MRLTKGFKQRIYDRENGICQSPLQPSVCMGKTEPLPLESCCFDYIRSPKIGGTISDDNLRILCPACLALKNDGNKWQLISEALKQGIVPADWRQYTWGD